MNDLNSKLSSPDIETMDYSRQLAAFVAVANSGGFNVAGRQLKMSPPLVPRLNAELEDRIGTRMYVPTMRQVTEANLMLVEQMRQMSEFKNYAATLGACHPCNPPTQRLAEAPSICMAKAVRRG